MKQDAKREGHPRSSGAAIIPNRRNRLTSRVQMSGRNLLKNIFHQIEDSLQTTNVLLRMNSREETSAPQLRREKSNPALHLGSKEKSMEITIDESPDYQRHRS